MRTHFQPAAPGRQPASARGQPASPRGQPAAPREGTTLRLAAPGRRLDPHVGGASAAAHRESGAVVLPGVRPGLRRDVDTVTDLDEAVRLGVGAWTRAVIDARDALPQAGPAGSPPPGALRCPKV